MPSESQLRCNFGSPVPIYAKFLEHSTGQDLFTELHEFISSNWNIDTATSTMWVNKAVAKIDAEMNGHQQVGKENSSAQGGLGICRERKVREFINANLDQQISVKQLASLSRLSSSQFQRAFKQSFGVATHNYVIQKRIERAKEMIISTTASFSDIATACGFSDQSHMTRMFARSVGETPNSWRRHRI